LMKQRLKIVLICVCAILLVAASVLGTLAYLTDFESATNTMTVGKVYISLDEADVDEQGKVESNERVTENKYHLIPGQTYVKDPTVTVEAKSEECYVRMLVEVKSIDELKAAMPKEDADFADYYVDDTFLLQYLCNGWDAQTWLFEDYDNGVYEFRYNGTVAKSESDTKLAPLFTEITVPGAIENEQIAHLQGVEIVVTAQAVQAAGFDTADAAWSASFDKVTP